MADTLEIHILYDLVKNASVMGDVPYAVLSLNNENHVQSFPNSVWGM